MASLQKVQVRGYTYWRIVESRRINGKPRSVPILHLGTADALLERLRSARGAADGAVVSAWGCGDADGRGGSAGGGETH